jgi:hypothetical protein
MEIDTIILKCQLAETIHPPNEKSYANYIFDITYKGKSWQVKDRYKTLSDVKDWLIKKFPKYKYPEFPSKVTLFRSKDEVLNDRKKGLEAFFQYVLNQQELFHHYKIQSFFSIKKNIRSDYPEKEGLLWLKIIEAIDLTIPEDTKHIDPLVRFRLARPFGGHKAPHLSTHPCHKSTSPKWFEEFTVVMSSTLVPLNICAWDHRVVKSNVLLGQTQLDISTAEPFKIYDEFVNLSATSKLHVAYQFQEVNVTANPKLYLNQKLPAMRIILDKKDYYPGEVMNGLIVYNIGTVHNIKGISLKIAGSERSYWTKIIRRNRATKTKVYKQVHPFFSHTIPLTLEKNEPGSHVWPISFKLPENLPPSFSHINGSIYYYCEGLVQISGHKDEISRLPFKVHINYTSLNKDPVLMLNDKKLNMRDDQVVSITTSMAEGSVIVAGQPKRMQFSIENKSKYNVKKMSIFLVGRLKVFAGGSTHVVQLPKLLTVLDGKEGLEFPLYPNRMVFGEVSLHVPETIPATILHDASPLVHLDYAVVSECDMSGFMTGEVKANLGVIINHAQKTFPAEKLLTGQEHYPGLFADHSPATDSHNPFDAVGPTASAQEQENNAHEEGVKSDDNEEGDEDEASPRAEGDVESPRDIIEGVSSVHNNN